MDAELTNSIRTGADGTQLGGRDVTADLAQSLSILRATLESTADGIVLVDMGGRIVIFNQKYLDQWGLEPGMLANGNADAVPHAIAQLKDPQYVLSTFGQLMSDPETVWQDEIEFNDGRVLERYSQPQKVGKCMVGRVWSFRDITARRAAEEQRGKLEAQLRQSQKMEAIGTLAGGIAHDFNNLLYAIKGYGELAQDSLETHSQPWEDIAEVLRAAQRAEDLVRQILTFCRKAAAKRVPVGLVTIVKEVAKMMRATLPATIEVRQVVEVSDATVIADPVEVHQLLMNLCTNAAQAMADSGGVLEISLRYFDLEDPSLHKPAQLQPGHYFLLSVSDTGMGIDDELLDRIFEPFFTTKDVGEGTGLGLAIVHGIARELGGAVTVYSEPARGSTFRAYLPCAEGKPPNVAVAVPQRGSERILFVDDEEALARLGKQALEGLGYAVEAFISPLAALERFTSAPFDFDIVITDETMPRLRGSEMAEKIAELRPGMPIVLCTGFSQRLDDLPLLEYIHAVLNKPLTRAELSHAIRSALEQGEEFRGTTS